MRRARCLVSRIPEEKRAGNQKGKLFDLTETGNSLVASFSELNTVTELLILNSKHLQQVGRPLLLIHSGPFPKAYK